MSSMKLRMNFPITNSYKYIYMIFSLMGSFWLMSLFEFYMNSGKNIGNLSISITILFRFLNDFWAVIFIGLALFPLYIILVKFSKKWSVIIFKIIYVILVLLQFSLIKYSLTTLINLGADILGYSISDITLTISSTESVSFLYSLQFVAFPLVFLVLYNVIKKYGKEERKITLILSALMVVCGSLKLLAFEASETKFKNKIHYLITDIIRFQKEKNEVNSYDLNDRNDYPLLKPFDETKDVLAPFFNIAEEKPNVVLLVVEGLGSEFVGDYSYSGFTPFLDSLIPKSLYWENFVSTTSRTFGALPSLVASLPFGDKGFLEIKKTPSHISLINVLKANGYTTSFFVGHDSSFDRKINFLEYNGIDNVFDESKFGPEYIKTEENDGGFAWGYPDAEIYRKTLASLDDIKQPRFDIIMTLTNHEPFEFPYKEKYRKQVRNMLDSKLTFGISKKEILNNIEIFASLLYTDESIKSYIEGYSKRPEFKNTIFIITGDHRLVPITQKDKLCRYHVPLFIYSPMLKKAERFKSISSHFDITPSILSFLMNNYEFNKLEESAWLGQGIDTARQFRNIHQIPLMRYKGKISDFIYKDYLYSDGELFKINENFGTYKVSERELIKTISDSLKAFKELNNYVTRKNRIYPDSLNIYIKQNISFSEDEMAIIEKETAGLIFDEVFSAARDFAFDKQYKKARLLCNYILSELPNHTDARTLKGRTLAWEGNYNEAEFELLNVIKRNPYISDAYLALIDLYWWSNQDENSIPIYRKAIENGIIDPEIVFKLAKAQQRLNNVKSAKKLMDSITRIYPENKEYQKLKTSIK